MAQKKINKANEPIAKWDVLKLAPFYKINLCKSYASS